MLRHSPCRLTTSAVVLLALLAARSSLAASPPGTERFTVARESLDSRGSGPLTAKSNMGFKFDTAFTSHDGESVCLWVAIPAHFFFEDAADSSAAEPCAGGTGDGITNADDVLCDWWSSERGGMTVSRWNGPAGQWESRTVHADPVTGQTHFTGSWTSPLIMGDAVRVVVHGIAGETVRNPATLIGNHIPETCYPLDAPSGVALLNLPYHQRARTADEILCGLRDSDWDDLDGDGLPDTCPNGIFNDTTGGLVEVHRIVGFEANPDYGLRETRTLHRDPGTGQLVFGGPNFQQIHHEAVLAIFEPGQVETTYCAPTF